MTKFKKYAVIWIGVGVLAAPYYIWKDMEAKERYEAGIQCVAAYSLARNFAEKAGDKAQLKRLTAAQDKVFLKFKAGELLRSDIETAKRAIPNNQAVNPDDYCAAF